MKKLNLSRKYLQDSAKDKPTNDLKVADISWEKVKAEHHSPNKNAYIIRVFDQKGNIRIVKGASIEGYDHIRLDEFERLKEAFKVLRTYNYKTFYALSVSNERLRDTYSAEEKSIAFNRNYKKSALTNGILYLGWRGDVDLILKILKDHGLNASNEQGKKIQIKIAKGW